MDPKIPHKVQPFNGHRTSWKTFEFHWRAYLIAQDRKYRELLDKIDDPTKDVRNGDLDLENQGLWDATRERGRVDSKKPRGRCRGMETDSRRVCLDRAGIRSRHVVPVGRSSVPSGLRHCGRHQQDGRGHDQVPEDGWGKSVRHHQGRHPHEGPDKRSRAAEARVSQQYTPQHVREDGKR